MSETTGIEWTDATINFWWGCSKVSPGCDHCYAETWAARFGESLWGVGAPRRKIKGAVGLLYKLQNSASWWAADAVIGKFHPNSARRVFIQSMSDLFDKEVPDEWFDEAWNAIRSCGSLDLQLVTKRVSFVEKRLAGRPWPKHARLIISIVNQEEADRDIPRLIELKHRLGIPCIGLSMEPLLGRVVLRDEWLAELGWIIVGGESGAKARPMHPDWARSLRDQCAEAGVSFLFKQWGEWIPAPEIEDAGGVSFHTFADGTWVQRVGKKAAGRLLDGVQHDGFPA
ncbi:phage Gp37/Gp68 family protein [Novosphingobium sp.]|uniref:phage Gp37/Gp68 family protein n=1 Tax=Novosphingobium sp. TaxID=1874826 RepID=UPI00286E13AB|nr:phage Gp37/Gp68 family protein [Novosphingobium sp.]